MKNTKTFATQELLTEEARLIKLLDRLAGVRVVKSNRARAQKSLQCVQAELNRRAAA